MRISVSGSPTLTLKGSSVTVPLSQFGLNATSSLTIELLDNTATGITHHLTNHPTRSTYLTPAGLQVTSGYHGVVLQRDGNKTRKVCR